MTVTGPNGRLRETAHQVLVLSASITYFLPGSNALPATSSSAWLVVTAIAVPYFATSRAGVPGFGYTRPMTGNDVTLALPGRSPVPARTTRTGRPSGGLFDGGYYWQVPANTAGRHSADVLAAHGRLRPRRVYRPPNLAGGGFRGAVQVYFSTTYQAPAGVGANSAGTSSPSTLSSTQATRDGQVASPPRGRAAGGPVPWLVFALTAAGVIAPAAFALRRPAGVLPAWAAGARRSRARAATLPGTWPPSAAKTYSRA